MAMETVMGSSNFVMSTKMEVGDYYEGYLLGVEVKEAKSKTGIRFTSKNIKLLDKEGNVITLTPSGNLNYMKENIEDPNHKLTQYAYTRIEKTGERSSKNPQHKDPVGVFTVGQDLEDVVDAEEAEAKLAEEAEKYNQASNG